MHLCTVYLGTICHIKLGTDGKCQNRCGTCGSPKKNLPVFVPSHPDAAVGLDVLVKQEFLALPLLFITPEVACGDKYYLRTLHTLHEMSFYFIIKHTTVAHS